MSSQTPGEPARREVAARWDGLGALLVCALRARGTTQVELVEASGVSRATVNQIIGSERITPSTAGAIAAAIGTTSNRLRVASALADSMSKTTEAVLRGTACDVASAAKHARALLAALEAGEPVTLPNGDLLGVDYTEPDTDAMALLRERRGRQAG